MATTATPLSLKGRVSVAVPRHRRRPIELWLALAVVIIAFGAAIFAPYITVHSPTNTELTKALKPPAWLSGGTSDYFLGTDRYGRDVLTRIIFGLRISLTVSVVGALVLAAVGGVLAILAGFLGGVVDSVIQRLAETSMALPGVLIALVLAITRGPSLENVLIVIVLIYWARIALPIRGEVLAVRERGFVRFARVANARSFYIMLRHVLPHVRDTAIVLLTLVMGQLILTEASLSFLGAGVPPPTPSLGGMVSEGLSVLERGWWVSVFPGVVITLLIVSANLLGDWLRDRWDPRLQNL